RRPRSGHLRLVPRRRPSQRRGAPRAWRPHRRHRDHAGGNGHGPRDDPAARRPPPLPGAGYPRRRRHRRGRRYDRRRWPRVVHRRSRSDPDRERHPRARREWAHAVPAHRREDRPGVNARLAAVAVVLVSIVAACGTGGGEPLDAGAHGADAGGITGSGPSAGTVEIGVRYVTGADQLVNLLGAQGFSVPDTKAMAQAMIDDINARGGLAGLQIVPVWHAYDASDPAGTATQEQTACSFFTEDHHVPVVVSPIFSSEVLQ